MNAETSTERAPLTGSWPMVLAQQFDDPGRMDTTAVTAAIVQANDQINRTEEKPVATEPVAAKTVALPAYWQN